MISDQVRDELVKKLAGSIDKSIYFVTRLPKLQDSPRPEIGVANMMSDSINAKRELLDELTILNKAVENLARRIGLPVIVGLMGKYSSGKSTLLNAFFKCVFGEKIPSKLLRETGLIQTDLKFTYITTPKHRERVPETDSLAVIVDDNPLLRDISFVDTPGTGWETFSKREVVNLLSAADIILFLFKPTEVLDAQSVEALHVKFQNFPTVPTWYVVTSASAYIDEDHATQQGAVEEQQFKEDVRQALQKLRYRKGDAVDRQKRDLVVESIDFNFGTNLFLVDGKSGYNVRALLEALRREFGSESARDAKTELIDADIRDRHGELASVLLKAEKHIGRLADLLHQTCELRVRDDLSRFKTTVISSDMAFFGQQLLFHLRQNPLLDNLDTSSPVPDPVPSPQPHQVPEVMLLELALEEMHTERSSPRFLLRRTDIVFDTNSLRTKIETARRSLERFLDEELESKWRDSGVNHLLGRDSESLAAPNSLVTQTEAKLDEILKQVSLDESSQDNAEEVSDFFQRKVGRLLEYYRSGQADRTLFKSQRQLLDWMKSEYPAQAETSAQDINAMIDKNAMTVDQLCAHLEKMIADHRAKMVTKCREFIEESVETPIERVLDLILLEVDLPDRRSQRSTAREPEAPDGTNTHDSIKGDLQDKASSIQRQSQESIDALASVWQKEWWKLDTDFRTLAQNGTDVADEIEAERRKVDTRLRRDISRGLDSVANRKRELHSRVVGLIRAHRDHVRDSMSDAHKRLRKIKISRIISVVAGFAAALTSPFYYAATRDNNLVTIVILLAILAGGLTAAIWGASQLITHYTTLNKLAEEVHKRNVLRLMNSVRDQFQEFTNNTEATLRACNESLRRELAAVFDTIIEKCTSANSPLVSKFSEQMKSATELCVDTTRKLAELERASVHSLVTVSTELLAAYCDKTKDRMHAEICSYVDEVGTLSISRIETYIKRYRQYANHLQNLRRDANRALKTAGL